MNWEYLAVAIIVGGLFGAFFNYVMWKILTREDNE